MHSHDIIFRQKAAFSLQWSSEVFESKCTPCLWVKEMTHRKCKQWRKWNAIDTYMARVWHTHTQWDEEWRQRPEAEMAWTERAHQNIKSALSSGFSQSLSSVHLENWLLSMRFLSFDFSFDWWRVNTVREFEWLPFASLKQHDKFDSTYIVNRWKSRSLLDGHFALTTTKRYSMIKWWFDVKLIASSINTNNGNGKPALIFIIICFRNNFYFDVCCT